jgi:tetratricopeptide (TPR) repeat protein
LAAFSLHCGVACFNKGNCGQALIELNEALRLEPLNADILYRRGLTYLSLKDDAKAIAAPSLLVNIDPLSSGAYYFRGQALMDLK